MELRPATRDRLGAIVVGDGLNITEEGVLTVEDKPVEHERYIEFSRERLNQLFNASKARRRSI